MNSKDWFKAYESLEQVSKIMAPNLVEEREGNEKRKRGKGCKEMEESS